MDILNCFRYVKQPHNFIQPLVRLRTSCPWCSLLGADQGRCCAGHFWEVQLWSSVLGTASVGTSLGTVPESTGSQDGAGVMPLLPSVSSALLPREPLPRGRKVGNAAQPVVRWVVISALDCSPVHGPARTLLF